MVIGLIAGGDKAIRKAVEFAEDDPDGGWKDLQEHNISDKDVVIGIAAINGLANKKISYIELLFTNIAIVAVTYGLEKLWLLKHESRRTVIYEKIELIKPENHQQLMDDLCDRTGLNIHRLEIGRVDFMRDTARIRIFYFDDGTNYSSLENESER